MPSNYTENYHLNQWEKTDQVLMEDFNADNLAIEDALTALAAADATETAARTAAISSINTALGKKGNVTLSTFTYQGTNTYGESNPTRVPFPRMPAVFMIAGNEGILVGKGGQNEVYGCLSANGYTHTYSSRVSWSGSTCVLCYTGGFPSLQMNETSTHLVIAFYTES